MERSGHSWDTKEKNAQDLVSVRGRNGLLGISPQLLSGALGTLEGAIHSDGKQGGISLGEMLGLAPDMMNWRDLWGI